VSGRTTAPSFPNVLFRTFRAVSPALFWYFAIALGTPLARGADTSAGSPFIEHAAFVIAIPVVSIALLGVVLGARLSSLARRLGIQRPADPLGDIGGREGLLYQKSGLHRAAGRDVRRSVSGHVEHARANAGIDHPFE
jgi:hypothetical protein